LDSANISELMSGQDKFQDTLTALNKRQDTFRNKLNEVIGDHGEIISTVNNLVDTQNIQSQAIESITNKVQEHINIVSSASWSITRLSFNLSSALE